MHLPHDKDGERFLSVRNKAGAVCRNILLPFMNWKIKEQILGMTKKFSSLPTQQIL